MRCGLVDWGMAERPLLHVPRQHDLGRALRVSSSDAADGLVVEGAALVAALGVEGDPADRRPRLGQDAVLGVEGLDVTLLEDMRRSTQKPN